MTSCWGIKLGGSFLWSEDSHSLGTVWALFSCMSSCSCSCIGHLILLFFLCTFVYTIIVVAIFPSFSVLLNSLYLKQWVSPFYFFSDSLFHLTREEWANTCVVLSCLLSYNKVTQNSREIFIRWTKPSVRQAIFCDGQLLWQQEELHRIWQVFLFSKV